MSEPTSAIQPRTRPLATFAVAARRHGVSERTMRNYLAKKKFDGYRMRGIPGVLLDLDEVDAAMRKMQAVEGKASPKAYGGAKIVEVAPQPVITDDGLRGNR